MMQDVALCSVEIRKLENKSVLYKPFFCDQTQGHNTGNARIESESILALHCIATRVDVRATQRNET